MNRASEASTAGPGAARDALGFTLLEVMVALAILGTGLAAVSLTYSLSLRELAQARQYEEARMEADRVLARMLARGGEPAFSEQGRGERPGYSWRAEGRPDPVRGGVSEVTVTVFFPPGSRGRELSLATAQADMDLPVRTGSQAGAGPAGGNN